MVASRRHNSQPFCRTHLSTCIRRLVVLAQQLLYPGRKSNAYSKRTGSQFLARPNHNYHLSHGVPPWVYAHSGSSVTSDRPVARKEQPSSRAQTKSMPYIAGIFNQDAFSSRAVCLPTATTGDTPPPAPAVHYGGSDRRFPRAGATDYSARLIDPVPRTAPPSSRSQGTMLRRSPSSYRCAIGGGSTRGERRHVQHTTRFRASTKVRHVLSAGT